MNELLTRATALATALSAKGGGKLLPDAIGDAFACATALVEGGYAEQATRLAQVLLAHKCVGDGEWGPQFEAVRARAMNTSDEFQACFEIASRGLAKYPDRPITQVALLVIYRAAGLWRRNRVTEAIELLSELRQELLRLPDTPIHAACALHLSSAMNIAGRRQEARDMAMEALVAAQRCESLFWMSCAHANLATIDRQACHWGSSIESSRRAIEGFERLENRWQLLQVRRALAITLWKRGRNSAALGMVEECLENAALTSSTTQLCYLRMLEGLIRMHMGMLTEARSALDAAKALLADSQVSRPNLLVMEYLGDLEMEHGRTDLALQWYEEALRYALVLVPRGDVVAELRRRMAEVRLLMGDSAAAHTEALEAINLSGEVVERYDEVVAYRVLACALVKRGRLDEAKRAFDRAFDAFDEIQTPYEWGRLWLSYGDWLSEEERNGYGSLSQALEAYRSAHECFERCESRIRLDEARTKLEQLGSRMREANEPYIPSELKARPRRKPSLNAELTRRSQWAFDNFGMVTRSEGILEMLEDVARVAVSELPVLVLGESGTGKELVAQGVHRLSGRVGDFLAVNASAVPESMLESEFFGHVKGAFTNAVADKAGLFEAAHEGTIFLDEIGEMSVDLQAKLLRYLESGVLRRVGGTRDVKVDVRVVAATNRSREDLQKGSGFRSDLYYRLAHAVYTLPPLRQRGDDVELLIEHYLGEFNRASKRHVTLSAAARKRMLEYGWPGNVRQLRAVLQKMVVSATHEGPLTPRDVPLDTGDGTPTSLAEEMDARERASIEAALRETKGNKSRAANLLNMRRTSLTTKMKRLGLMP